MKIQTELKFNAFFIVKYAVALILMDVKSFLTILGTEH